jgi:hypothetical protein
MEAAATAAGLSKESAAEGFAVVASAMSVSIMDHLVGLTDDKKLPKEEMEKRVVELLDQTSVFIGATGELFGQLFSGVSVEPVVYNGRSKRNKLEQVFAIYTKASMDIAAILSQAGGQQGDTGSRDMRMDGLGKVR